MSLTLRNDSSWWYGKFRLPNGKFLVKNLNVTVDGIRPPTLREPGDDLFEASRTQAQKEHDKILNSLEDKRAGIKYARNLLELATAEKHVSPLIEKMADLWMQDHRIREVKNGESTHYEGSSLSHIKHSKGALDRFARFMRKNEPAITSMAGVTGNHILAFLDTVDAEKLSPRTWNYYLVLLREMFTRHEPDTSACKYLKETEKRDEDTTHRKPFSDQQLQAISVAAKKDAFILPIIVMGINTPLRLGDCCNLLWKDVDLKDKYLTIKRTSKTDKGVQIPIWPQLFDELSKQPRNGDKVFPELAAMYTENPYGINSRLKDVFAKAEIRFYSKDKPANASAPAKAAKRKSANRSNAGDANAISQDGEPKQTARGPRRVNEMAFHAFRVTYVTRALLQGVNEEVLRKATGHATVDLVRKYYFQPAKEAMRAELDRGRPDFASVDSKTPMEKLRSILTGMSALTWNQDREQMLQIIAELNPSHAR